MSDIQRIEFIYPTLISNRQKRGAYELSMHETKTREPVELVVKDENPNGRFQ